MDKQIQFNSSIDESLAKKLHENHMGLLGIENTMKLAHNYNNQHFNSQNELREALYESDFEELIKQNGALVREPIELNDGWVIDNSMTLPHLQRVLDASDRIIEERAGKRKSVEGAYRSYFQDVWDNEKDPSLYPEFLDFVTSSDVIYTVANYLKCIPALTTTLPSGIRFVESNQEFDDQPDNPHDSQLYHIDYYSLPNVYMLVLLQDTTSDHGPWTFIPKARSQRIKKELGYWGPERGYRVTDADVLSLVDPDEVIEFTGKRGSVLFIESSGCFHFGSRNSIKPRFQLMIGYSGACRTDFSEIFMKPKTYPINSGDSRLRKLVLDKNINE